MFYSEGKYVTNFWISAETAGRQLHAVVDAIVCLSLLWSMTTLRVDESYVEDAAGCLSPFAGEFHGYVLFVFDDVWRYFIFDFHKFVGFPFVCGVFGGYELVVNEDVKFSVACLISPVS